MEFQDSVSNATEAQQQQCFIPNICKFYAAGSSQEQHVEDRPFGHEDVGNIDVPIHMTTFLLIHKKLLEYERVSPNIKKLLDDGLIKQRQSLEEMFKAFNDRTNNILDKMAKDTVEQVKAIQEKVRQTLSLTKSW